MTQTNKLATAATVAVLGSALPALAGSTTPVEAPESNPCGDWCDTLKGIGTVYKNGDNPYVQELKFFGRYQWQSAHIDGNDVNGDDFNSSFATHRRFRLGAQMKFANYFKLKANVNLVADAKHTSANSINWGFPDVASAVFDEAKLTFDAGKAFGTGGLDQLHFTYGRQKLKMSQEAHTSSKKIKTVERSALANTIYRSARPVGFTVDAAKGSWSGAFAVFSDQIAGTEWDSVIGEWSDGIGYYANVTKTFSDDSELLIDFLYHDDSGDALVDWFGYDWAASVAYAGDCGRWGYMANAIVGDHGDLGNEDREGLFYGAVLMGTYWIAQDSLELVGQYQWQGSEESEGVRTNSRYFRADNGGDVNSGRGDSHHSLYAGLNWYLCGDNAKIMTGVEYQNLDTPDGDADGTTLWLAFRTYF
ncbi:hypothetical protein HW115_12960 [Verrucomicrobiaceae bacterium N1E253]|uniref:Porin n=1 Tax=Oceaniferula marina TaxID=2748318 RepID=A0A851GQS3_9BACT|nr:porin [Oceaniferula marina]NWK56524.1 hypothetical protein [Oceaniferula marina]